jgi:hypothetical protein
MSQFWQNTQRRLHPEKKIVPEPLRPRRQSSSPKWGKYEATTARRPIPPEAHVVAEARDLALTRADDAPFLSEQEEALPRAAADLVEVEGEVGGPGRAHAVTPKTIARAREN